MTVRVKRLLVFPEHSRLRLDRFLAAATGRSRRRARRWIEAGRVRMDGATVRRLSRQVRTAQVVEVEAPAEELEGIEGPQPPPVEVVHEDPALLVVNKPSGVLSQPAERPRPGDLAMDQRVRLHLAAREGRRPPYLALIHRLDRVSSGLLVFARTREAAGSLSEAFRRGRVERGYLAVVEGEPSFSHLTVDRPIARARGFDWKFETTIPKDPDGKPARTEVTVERVGEGWARVRCRLLTGRTHQVRVHLAELGHSVSGDRLYGSTAGSARVLLHAARLTLPHPGGQGPSRLELEAPLPADFEPYLEPDSNPDPELDSSTANPP